MPRRAREVIAGLPHHIYLRGNNRRRLFSFEPDYRRFISYVELALEQTPVALHAMTLMTNHAHLITTPTVETALGAFVKIFAQRYSTWRNRKLGATGKLFEARYKTVIITSDEQLAVTTAYNDLNAKRAGMVEDPLDYPWSTYAIHVGRSERCRIPARIWTPSPWYISLGADPAERATVYRDFATAYDAARSGFEPLPSRVPVVVRPDGSSAL